MKSLRSVGGANWVLAVVLGLAWANHGSAQSTQNGVLPGGGGQQPATTATAPSRTTSVSGFAPYATGSFPAGANVYYSGNQPQNDELSSALASWRDSANDAEARQGAKEKASQALATIYDELLNSQEQEIDALEKRVVELREQLGRRRQAKSKMVELKLEMLLSQTDGLGWPSSEPQSTRYFERRSTGPVSSSRGSGFGTMMPGVTPAAPAILPGTEPAPELAPARQ